jgi:hypothetical protein
MTTTTKSKTTFTALLLLAVVAFVPACDINRECNPNYEICLYTGGNPSGLAPKG